MASQTLDRVIGRKKQTAAEVAQTNADLAAANKASADAQGADAAVDATLKADLAQTGPVLNVLVDDEGKTTGYELWVPDTSVQGYHYGPIQVASATAVPGPVDPAPPPTPEPPDEPPNTDEVNRTPAPGE